MKLLSKFVLINVFFLAGFSAIADNTSDPYGQQINNNMEVLIQDLEYLGGYLGYTITTNPTTITPISQQLLSVKAIQLAEGLVFNTYFGAIPVALIAGSTAFQFLAGNTDEATVLNNMANATFTKQNYNSPAGQNALTVTVNSSIDQPTYQTDPVSQGILNILATPDSSYCTNKNGSLANPCPAISGGPNAPSLLSQAQVMSNVIGNPPPGFTDFFSYTYNQQLLPQLNSNSLIAPLYFSTDSTKNDTGSPQQPNNNGTTPGLMAQSPAQAAANFIRYVSGSVAPISLPDSAQYYSTLQDATGKTPKITPAAQLKAQNTLNSYFTGLRIYAAQNSVGLSNLYYILSKRLPQSPPNQTGNSPVSAAMSEYSMASWRLYQPSPTTGSGAPTPSATWTNAINNASSATVQKEIAVLLAEINYQMYLDRQIQERMLLTSSVMLLQGTKGQKPNSDFSSGGTGN